MIEALNNLPQSLEAAFDKTMRRIRDQRNHRRELALNCLMWITFARRPLIFEELSDAIAITTKPEMTAMDETYRMFRPPQKILTDCCHGLIVVDEESSIVRLVHYSVHEYLCHGQPPIFPRAEKAVAELCIAYQMLETFASGCRREEEDIIRLLDDCPFIAYAARHWVSLGARNQQLGLPVME